MAVFALLVSGGVFGWRLTRPSRPAAASPPKPAAKDNGQPTSPPAAVRAVPPEPEITNGLQAARFYCQSCHLFPDPKLLDKRSWEGALVQMALQLGVAQMDYSQRPDGQILLEAGRYPSAPVLPESQWLMLSDYYLAAAPAEPLPQPPHPPIRIGLPNFRVRLFPAQAELPRTCLVHIDPAEHRVMVADARTHTLESYEPTGARRQTIRLPGDPVKVLPRAEGYALTMIGRLLPSDELAGSVGILRTNDHRYAPILQGLRRPTEAVFADLDHDGREDVVVCEFGNMLGRIAWYRNVGDGKYEARPLFEFPGATQIFVRDLNRDGQPDLLALVGQAREGIYLFTNQGHGSFQYEALIEQSPAFGYSHLELVDFNGDGSIDFLTTNGDNGDYPSRPKGYHGIRLYLNDGHNRFHEAWFFPMHGAYKALARDFDGDGDLDIAAISFYPDYEHSPEESFVYLENKGALRFEPHSFPEGTAGRWLTMDAADVDGDGDDDIVLGSFLPGPTTIVIPHAISRAWQSNHVGIILLENARF